MFTTKIFLYLCKLFKLQVFQKDDYKYCVVSRHALKRVEKRMSSQMLLKLAMETVLEKGSISVHFDYYNNQKTEHARLYKGYIYILGAQNELITCYQATHVADLLVTRPVNTERVNN